MKKLIPILLILTGCSSQPTMVITYKSVFIENPAFATYSFNPTKTTSYSFTDSANKFNIGDSVIKPQTKPCPICSLKLDMKKEIYLNEYLFGDPIFRNEVKKLYLAKLNKIKNQKNHDANNSIHR